MTIGPVPPLATNAAAPQPADSTLVGGYATLFAVALLSTSASGDAYQHGTHALHVYEQNTVRKMWTIPRAPVGWTPRLPPLVTNANAPQSDPTQNQPQFWRSVRTPPAVASPYIAPFIQAGPQQFDFTLQPDIYNPEPGIQAKVPRLTVTVPQFYDFTLQASLDLPQPPIQGPVPPLANAYPQVDLTLQGMIMPASQSAARLGNFVVGIPQSDPTQIPGQVFWTTPKPGTPTSDQYEFGTHAAYLYELNTTRVLFTIARNTTSPTQRSPLISNANAPQPMELRTPTMLTQPLRGPTGTVPAMLIGQPPQIDFTNQGDYFAPQLESQGAVPALTVGFPQADPTQIQGQAWRLTSPLQGPAFKIVSAAPQTDPTQIAARIFSPVPAAPVPTGGDEYSYGAHSAYHYERNSTRALWTIARTPITQSQSPIHPVSNSGAPQIFDATQQGSIFTPIPLTFGYLMPWASGEPQEDPTRSAAGVFSAIQNGTVPVVILGPTVTSLSAAPQSDPTQIQGQIWSPLPVAPQPARASHYEFGTHAVAIYESQFKGRIWPSVFAHAPSSGRSSTFIGTLPQSFDFTLPARFFAPIPLPTGYLMCWADGSPQEDPTYPRSSLSRPLRGVLFTSLRSISAAPQVDLTQQASIWRSAQALAPMPIVSIGAAPQSIDLTQQGWIRGTSQSVAGPVPPTITAAPQQVDLTIQGWVDGTAPASQGVVPPLTRGAPDLVDLTQQARIIGISQPTQGQRPPFMIAAPQSVDLTLQGWIHATSQQLPGRVPPLTQGAPQSVDLTIQGWARGTSQAIQAKVPPLVTAAPQLVDLTLQASLDAPTQGPSIPIRIAQAAPEQIDLPWRGGIWSPTPLAAGVLIQRIATIPQSDPNIVRSTLFPTARPQSASVAIDAPIVPPQSVDLTIQGWISGAAPSPPQGKVPALVQGAPQLIDLTQPALILAPLPRALALPIPLIWAAPQVVDLTLQAVFDEPNPLRQAGVPAVVGNARAPQVIDLTVQGWTQGTPRSVGGPVPPMTQGAPQPDLNVSYSVLWTPAIYSPSALTPVSGFIATLAYRGFIAALPSRPFVATLGYRAFIATFP